MHADFTVCVSNALADRKILYPTGLQLRLARGAEYPICRCLRVAAGAK